MPVSLYYIGLKLLETNVISRMMFQEKNRKINSVKVFVGYYE